LLAASNKHVLCLKYKPEGERAIVLTRQCIGLYRNTMHTACRGSHWSQRFV